MGLDRRREAVEENLIQVLGAWKEADATDFESTVKFDTLLRPPLASTEVYCLGNSPISRYSRSITPATKLGGKILTTTSDFSGR